MAAKAKTGASKKPTESRTAQPITPYLYYADVDAALEWLSRAFGFKPMNKFAGPDGRTIHAAMQLGGGGIFMLGCPGPTYKNPRHLDNVTQGLYIMVEDVDNHYLRAKEAGAEIVSEPEDQFYGDRRYSAADPEGHHWYFAQHLRDVPVEEIARSVSGGA